MSEQFGLTQGQQAIWYLSQIDDGYASYNINAALRISPRIESDLVSRAVNQLLQRHPALRASFFLADGKLQQSIRDSTNLDIPLTDAEDMQDNDIGEYLRKISNQPFDLQNDWLLRCEQLQTSQASILHFQIHHIVSDFWSISILFDEFMEICNAEVEDRKAEHQSGSMDYREHCNNAAALLSTPSMQTSKAYWLEKLTAPLPVLTVGTSQKNSKSTLSSRNISFRFTTEETKQVQAFASANDVSIFATLLAAYARLLGTTANQNEVVVGIPTLGRSKAKQKYLCSYLVNPLPIHIQDLQQQYFDRLSKSVNKDIRAAMQHSRYPFSLIVQDLGFDRDPEIPPVYQTMFSFQRARESGSGKLAALAIEANKAEIRVGHFIVSSFPYDPNVSQFDLALNMGLADDQLCGAFQYRTNILDHSEVERLVSRFRQMVISSISEGRPEAVKPVAGLWSIIEKTCNNYSEHTALEYQHRQISYSALFDLTEDLCRYFISREIDNGDTVTIILPQGVELILCILALLKLKCHILVADQATPQARLDLMIQISSCHFVVTPGDQKPEVSRLPADNPVKSPKSLIDSAEVYVFTSGTTGTPRCIPLSESNLLAMASAMTAAYDLSSVDRVMQFTSPGFDVFWEELLPTLLVGATLVVRPPTLGIDYEELESFLSETRISVVNLPTAYWLAWIEQAPPRHQISVPGLRLVVVGGEELEPSRLARWQQMSDKNVHLINAYGPSEMTVTALTADVTHTSANSRVPIGLPVNGVDACVVDPQNLRKTTSNNGILCLRGKSLTRGYLDNVKTTDARFILLDDPAKQWFCTGDLVELNRNGMWVYRGRLDRQIKRHGVRIELSEIEKQLDTIDDISRSAVMAIDGRLVAFIESSSNIPLTQLREKLGVKLLAQMVPTDFRVYQQLPVTAAGKIDYAELRSTIAESETSNPVHSDRSNVSQVEDIVTQHLKTPINIEDNLFDFGLDSIMAVSIALELTQQFGCKVPVREIFANPTIAELQNYLGKIEMGTDRETLISDDPLEEDDSILLTPGQQRASYLKKIAGNRLNTDIRVELKLDGALDSLAFHSSWITTLAANDVFMCQPINETRQTFAQTVSHDLIYLDASTDSSKADPQQLFETSLRLDQAPLIKAALVRYTAHSHSLFIAASPVVVDAESLGRMLENFASNYRKKAGTYSGATGSTDYRFRNYATRVNALPDPVDFWNDKLQQCNTTPDLLIKNDSQAAAFQSDTLILQTDSKLSTDIAQLAATLFVSSASVFLAAYFILITRYLTRNASIGIGMATTHRGLFGTGAGIGPFTNFVIVNQKIDFDEPFEQVVKLVQAEILMAVEHQHVNIRDLLGLLERRNTQLPVECLFLYHDQPLGNPEFDSLSVRFEQHGDMFRPALLTLEITQSDQGFCIEIHYDRGKYGATAITAFGEALEQLLGSAVADPVQSVKTINLLPPPYAALGRGSAQVWREPCELLHTTFTLTARQHPFRTAFIVGERKISYGQTYRFTTRISNIIHEFRQSLANEAPLLVGIIMEKGWEQVVAALGVLRGGGVYAPINPAFQQHQISNLLQSIGIKIVITTTLNKKSYDWPEGVLVLTLDDRKIRRASLVPIRKRTIGTRPEDPAYIMFTSGTTGTPKAVMISHKAALNTIYDLNQRLELKRGDIFFGISNFHFDLSVYDLFGAFSKGARIVFPDPERLIDPNHWEHLLRKYKVTIWNSVPALYQLLLDQLKTPYTELRYCLLSGDWIPLDLPGKSNLSAPNTNLLSLGGATEGSIWSIAFPIDTVDSDWHSIPYGLPLSNQNISVLDPDLQPCPPDVPGELHIGGDGVAMEYYKQPDLTSAAFIIDPRSGERLYKTRDLGMLSSKGYFEILGRIDNQVKIAGQFVNLAVIESTLETSSDVTSAAVVGLKGKDMRTELRAFVTSEHSDPQFVRTLREQLSKELPTYMVPSRYALLDQMPLTDNAKVDREKLAAFQGEFVSFKSEGVTPRTEMEVALASAWEQILDVSELSVNDNFFDLGGDSLLTVHASVLLQEVLGFEVPLQTLIAYQTIATLAPVLEGLRQNSNIEQSEIDAAPDILKGEMPAILLKESFLDESISGDFKALPDQGNSRRVLLTGATGYLGSHLLVELLHRTEAEIYCLTRADDELAAEERISNKLAAITDLTEEMESRIIPVKGDLSKPLLGLTSRDFALLAERVDYVLHCAADVNFVMPRSALRQANVGGATEILRLAALGKPAAVGYVSTVSVFPTIAQNIERVFRENDDLDQSLPIVGGYSQSKLIAENNMHIARERGIPVSIFRPGVIFGDTRIGDLPTDVMLVSFIQLCAKMRIAPDLNLLVDIAPVDYVSSAIVALSALPPGTFHLTNPKPIALNKFVETLRMSGLNIETVPQDEWFAKAKRLKRFGDAGTAAVMLEMAGDLESIGSIAFGRNLQQFDCSNTIAGLAKSEIRCPEIDTELLQKFVPALDTTL